MGSTLREALESAVSAQEAKESTLEAAPVETVEATPVEAVQPAATEVPIGETAEQRTERLRDEKGRFAEGKAEAKPKAAKVVEAKPAAVAAPVAPVPKLAKPDSWKKEKQADWDALTPSQQAYVKEREDQYFKGISTYQQEWKGAKPLLDALAPFMPELEANNIKPDEWIKNLGNAHYTLAKGSPQQKLQMFAQLSRDYGVPLQALFDPQIAQQYVQQTVQQPARPAPQQDIGSLVRQELMTAKLNDEIASFETAKDAEGKSLHPHYAMVRDDMALLLEAGKATDLNSAYRMALRLHDDLFEAEQESKRKADDTARQEAQRTAVKVAKGSAVSVRSATPASAGAAPKKGIRAQLEEAYDQHANERV
ncbi:MAG: hypothetical protein WAW75_05510 [Gallionella sp.]